MNLNRQNPDRKATCSPRRTGLVLVPDLADSNEYRRALARGLNPPFARIAREEPGGVYTYTPQFPGATAFAWRHAEQLDQLTVTALPGVEWTLLIQGYTRTRPAVPVQLVLTVPSRMAWTELIYRWRRHPVQLLHRLWGQTQMEALL